MKRFLGLLRQKRFHIIQTFFEDSIFVCYFGGLLSPTKPLLLSSRRDVGLGSDEPWYHALYRMALPVVNRHFDGILANGENVKEFVARREKILLSKINVIHNGVTIPEHAELKPLIFKQIHGDFWIGIVANLKPVKRIDVFLRAVAHLKSICKGINIQALILGDGSEKENLQNIAGELNILSNVHFMGTVKNITSYLQYLDAAVLCSDREGVPNSVLEYMACGLPVVTTAAGGTLELVDAINGFCVPRGDHIAIAECLAKLALSYELRKKMGSNSLEKVKLCYSWDSIIKKWESYYRSLLHERHIMNLHNPY
jgi:glycosyltransferase involved in cell wall biosynthesis